MQGDASRLDIIEGVSEVVFWVESLDRCVEFYCRYLGFRVESIVPGHHAFLHSGARSPGVILALFIDRPENDSALARNYLARHEGEPRGRFYHVAFRVDPATLDAQARWVHSKGIAVSDPVTFSSGRRSYFLEDPEGHYLELTDR